MICFITWQRHQRTDAIAQYLGIESKVFSSKKHRLLKYPLLVWQTISYLFREKPKTVIVQCPSVFLALFTRLLKPLLGYRLVIDAHNACVIPDNWFSKTFFSLYRWVHRQADLTIVTNDELATQIEQMGAKAFILPDKVFEPPAQQKVPLKGKHNVLLVSSYMSDEPCEEAIRAFADMQDTCLYLSGKAPQELRDKFKDHDNIIFTGFIPRADYYALLASVDVVMGLTTRESCMLCSAYEAVSFGKPLITSDKRVLRAYFNKGAQYTQNTAETIGKAYQDLMQNYDHEQQKIIRLKQEINHHWELQGKVFKDFVNHRSPEPHQLLITHQS
jgi:glycosyltransferase involved in cell wall biosynthesis